MKKENLDKLNAVLTSADKMFKQQFGIDLGAEMSKVQFAPTVDAEDMRRALEPFSDQLKLFIKIGDKLFCMGQPQFKMLGGEGVLILTKGMEISI